MYSKIHRDDIYKSRLLEFINREYALKAGSLAEAKRGFYGETWMIETQSGKYFVKLDYSSLHKSVFSDSIAVVEHLCKHGITCIPKNIKTANGDRFTEFDSAVLGIFEWIDGENIQNESTKISEYQMLSKIYTVPPEGVSLSKEAFDTDSIDAFLSLRERLKTVIVDDAANRLLRLLDEKAELILHYSERLMTFAKRCRMDYDRFFITHGDAGGNLIVNDAGCFMIDWDEPKLAPPERDAWFCMHWSWAMDAFHEALRQNGIEYIIRSDRLAFYCYHNFFYYLTEYLTAYFDLPDRRIKLVQSVSDYFDGWIKDNLRYAEKIE
jgi:hypothetical protein